MRYVHDNDRVSTDQSLQVAARLDAAMEADDIPAFLDLCAEDDAAFVIGTFTGRAKPDGREWSTRFVHHLTIADAGLLRWEAVFDPAAATSARPA